MQIHDTIASIREAMTERVALVPTMGNLHAGHLALMKQAKKLADTVVASIFVNRLQFRPGEDFEKYPRTFEADCARMREVGVDHVFAPTENVIYPHGPGTIVQPPPWLDTVLEGEFRPGHFAGVATIVLKLFQIVQPQVAVFGKKDYQQLMVIRTMVSDLDVPVEVVAGETVRSADGLALSSRNNYLTPAERAEAPRLSRTLRTMAQEVHAGTREFTALESRAVHTLTAAGWQPDYVVIRSRRTLKVPEPGERELVALAAARLGSTRLIDNLEF